MRNDGEPPQRMKLRERLARLIAGADRSQNRDTVRTRAVPLRPAAIRLRLKEFETSTVRDVMTARVDIAAVEATATITEVLGVLAAQAALRACPCIRESLDEPMGFIHIKDMSSPRACARAGAPSSMNRRVRVQARSRSRASCLCRSRSLLPDLLIQDAEPAASTSPSWWTNTAARAAWSASRIWSSSIVGEIEDEHDVARPSVIRRGRSVVGRRRTGDRSRMSSVRRACRCISKSSRIEVETMGGLVAVLGGRVLQAGESIEHPRGSTIEMVIEADPRRVIRLRLRIRQSRRLPRLQKTRRRL
jgi:magnesium and cobalt transporter